jgi:hypothetical protein
VLKAKLKLISKAPEVHKIYRHPYNVSNKKIGRHLHTPLHNFGNQCLSYWGWKGNYAATLQKNIQNDEEFDKYVTEIANIWWVTNPHIGNLCVPSFIKMVGSGEILVGCSRKSMLTQPGHLT